MHREPAPAELALCIDIAAPAADKASHSAMAEAVYQLVALWTEFGVPATWVVSDPRDWPELTRVRLHPSGHEIALLAERAWGAGDHAEFGAELAARVHCVTAMGFRVTTLALQGVSSPQDVSLLVRHGLSIIRGPSGSAANSGTAPVFRPVVGGRRVWHVPVSAVVDGRRGWWLSHGATRARRVVRGAARNRDMAVVVFDVAAAVERRMDLLPAARSILRLAQRFQRRGLLRLVSVQRLACLADQQRTPANLESLLRRAA